MKINRFKYRPSLTLWLLLVLCSTVSGAQQTLYLAKDSLQDGKPYPPDLASAIFAHIIQQSDQQFTFTYVQANQQREWQLIEDNPNYCLYNKLPTPQRRATAQFSQKPILSFPPNRLISHRPIGEGAPLDLNTVMAAKALIGVVGGRKYGTPLDRLIQHRPERFYIMEGSRKEPRLYDMLKQKKLDAIFEFTLSLASYHSVDALQSMHIYPIKELDQYLDGYIVCSNSDTGQRAISLFDAIMASPEYRRHTMTLLEDNIPANELGALVKRIGL